MTVFEQVNTPLFAGMTPEDIRAALSCIGYHVTGYRKGEIVAFEQEHIRHVGILLGGSVDMIKEDLWGNKTMLIRSHRGDIFGESFACGSDSQSVVTFVVSEDARVLFLPFSRVMHTCTKVCTFHHKLVENMVQVIADKNIDLMRKVEVVSKKSLREKILAYLSIQAQNRDSRYFEIPLGRLELADYLCADRSALTRELANMRADGLIDYDKNWFRIL